MNNTPHSNFPHCTETAKHITTQSHDGERQYSVVECHQDVVGHSQEDNKACMYAKEIKGRVLCWVDHTAFKIEKMEKCPVLRKDMVDDPNELDLIDDIE